MHEDLIAWDDYERKQCRDEWEMHIKMAQFNAHMDCKMVGYIDALDEAGLAAVRELRKLRRKVEKN